MDIYSPEYDQLVYLLMLSIPMGLLAERVVHVAMIRAKGWRPYARVDFVARDSVLMAVSFVICLGSILPAFIHAGPADTVTFVAKASQELPFPVLVFDLVLIVNLLTPVIVAICISRGRRRDYSTVVIRRYPQ